MKSTKTNDNDNNSSGNSCNNINLCKCCGSYLISQPLFWFMSIVALTWLYRLLFNWHNKGSKVYCKKKDLQDEKKN